MLLIGNKYFMMAYKAGRLNNAKDMNRALMLSRRTILESAAISGRMQHMNVRAHEKAFEMELVIRKKGTPSLLETAHEMQKDIDILLLKTQSQYDVIVDLEKELITKGEMYVTVVAMEKKEA